MYPFLVTHERRAYGPDRHFLPQVSHLPQDGVAHDIAHDTQHEKIVEQTQALVLYLHYLDCAVGQDRVPIPGPAQPARAATHPLCHSKLCTTFPTRRGNTLAPGSQRGWWECNSSEISWPTCYRGKIIA